jgi:S-DNA-T family DNA segregation ATPase FtsK/SpoIIIE
VEIEYTFPSSDFLNSNNLSKLNKEDKRELINNASKLEETLSSFGVEAKVMQVTKGPSVTRFEIQPNAGVKVSKIVNLSDDIALNLASSGVRIEAPIPGKSAVGIEVPNKELTPVYLREVIESQEFINTNRNLAFSLGKDIAGNCVVSDLTKMPHVLIAGATGSGKSVCINTLIISLLYKYSPEDVKLLMIDPKVVELSVYNGIPHLLIPVVTDPKKAAGALNWAVNEMTRRYKIFAENSVRNIEGYNELVKKGKLQDKLPWIVIIVDELADLMMVCPNDVEDYIGRLAQMARAAGMHLVIATQRPSVDVITGVIKANIPSRISFAVSSQIDSRTILDTAGAEKLLGKGDMLFYPVGESKPLRIQGAFISEEEVERVVLFIKGQQSQPEYRNEILEELDNNIENNNSDELDSLLSEAVKVVAETGQASTSLLQRKLRIGYNRAARIIEQMEELGIISGKDGSKPRQILIDKESALSGSYFHENNN